MRGSVYVLMRRDLNQAWVGSTKRDPKQRLHEHRVRTRLPAHQLFVGDEPIFQVLEEAPVGPELNASERDVAAVYKEVGWDVLSHHNKNYSGWTIEGGSAGGPIGGPKGVAILHAEKNSDGKSIHAIKMAHAMHAERDEQGRPATVMRTLKQRWACGGCAVVSNATGLSSHQKKSGHVGRTRLE